MSQQSQHQPILIAEPDAAVGAALQLLVTQRLGPHAIHVAQHLEVLTAPPVERHPTVVLVDWSLLGAAPTQTLATIRAYRPAAFIIVLSLEPAQQAMALAAGADAFLSKTEPPDRVAALIEHATRARQ